MERWYTILEIVDTDTGELLPRYKVDNKEYRIINKTIKFEQDEKRNNIKKITWECRKHEQTRIEF